MRRVTTSLTLASLALLLVVMPAVAARGWCMRDPIVTLNGMHVGIWVGLPEEYASLVTGPVDMKVSVPDTITGQLVYTDAGFNGYGENVHFKTMGSLKVRNNGSFDVEIEATVPIDKDALKNMGVKGKNVPMKLYVVINGELVEYADGTMEVIKAAYSVETEGTNDGAKITFTVNPNR